MVLAQRLPDGLDAVALTFWQFVLGAALVVPITVASASVGGSGSWCGQPTGGQVAAAFVAGAVGSAGAFVLYNWALARVGTTAAGVGLTLIPVFGIVFSAVVLDEALSTLTVLSAAAVVAGVVVVALDRVSPPARITSGAL